LPFHQAVCNQRGTVEVRLGDVKCPGRCQSIERAVFLLKDVFWKVIMERMEDAFRSGSCRATAALPAAQVGSTHNLGLCLRRLREAPLQFSVQSLAFRAELGKSRLHPSYRRSGLLLEI
jgi:hypothetical protein